MCVSASTCHVSLRKRFLHINVDDLLPAEGAVCRLEDETETSKTRDGF